MLKNTDTNNPEYWDERWKHQNTPWDIGSASTPIAAFIDQFEPKAARVLIPGCGNAHEASYLLQAGFTNISLVDISPIACSLLEEKFKDTSVQVICTDFFDLQGEYDLILEQTFFCALPPEFRQNYAEKMADLLDSDGVLAGVLFNRDFDFQGPPFGGTKEEYLRYFKPLFTIKKMEHCYNSIPPRAGNELFILLSKLNS